MTCNMESFSDKIVTILHHVLEDRTHVNGYETLGSYRADIEFMDIGKNYHRVKSVMDLTDKCEQHVKYECRGSMISDGYIIAGLEGRQILYNDYYMEGGGCQCILKDACENHNKTTSVILLVNLGVVNTKLEDHCCI